MRDYHLVPMDVVMSKGGIQIKKTEEGLTSLIATVERTKKWEFVQAIPFVRAGNTDTLLLMFRDSWKTTVRAVGREDDDAAQGLGALFG